LNSTGANWDAPSAWGPYNPLYDYPNAQGATASDLQSTNGFIVQNVAAGVNLGIIDNNPTTPFNSGNTINWTIRTDYLIVMNNGLSPAQINNTQAFGDSSLTINGTAGLSLTSDLVITNHNSTGWITISAPIVGNGGITTGGVGTTRFAGLSVSSYWLTLLKTKAEILKPTNFGYNTNPMKSSSTHPCFDLMTP